MTTLLVTPIDPDAPGGLMAMLELSEAGIALEDAGKTDDKRAMTVALRKIVDGITPYLETTDGGSVDAAMRALSITEFMDLLHAVQGDAPIPPANGSPSTAGPAEKASRRGGAKSS